MAVTRKPQNARRCGMRAIPHPASRSVCGDERGNSPAWLSIRMRRSTWR
jgi:hypothetical protein